MAIIHIAIKAISRKVEQSAASSASYRASNKPYDEKYDKTHDYSKNSGAISAGIILFSVLQAQGFRITRSEI
ncbi:hypothetical protein [Psychrobacter sp. GP33]|uniref:hypothetical protein n=1 Tax=Psychrobacter sp. GP33 TaxID=2758709 RepID=UPI0015FBD1DE|nr:hypothetical protein [Psychrobacter sp. GP33]